MRILIYSYNYHPEPIGIAPLMTELAEGLVSRGHQVRVLTGMPNYPEREVYPAYRGRFFATERRNGVLIQRSYVWIRPKVTLFTRILLDGSFVISSLGQALRGWRPEIILITVPPLPVSLPAALLGWLYRCPVVLNVQDILPEAAMKLGILRNPWAIRGLERLERFAYRAANAITVIAEGFVPNLLGKGVPRHKLHYIPNWVDVEAIQPRGDRPFDSLPNAFRQQHQLEGKFIVLYAGNIALTQGLETVIQAAQRLQTLPNLVVVIVGAAKARQRLQRLCLQEGVENVRLLGFEPRHRLPAMLAAADLGLLVQKRQVDTFNMPSKFALLLASGCPVVASVPIAGIAGRAVQESEAGVVVPPENPDALAEAIRCLYFDPQKRAMLSQQARQFAIQHYAREQCVDRYEALFAGMVNGRSPIHHPLDLPLHAKKL